MPALHAASSAAPGRACAGVAVGFRRPDCSPGGRLRSARNSPRARRAWRRIALALASLLAASQPVAAGLIVSLEGDFIQGGLVRGRVAPDAGVSLDGERVRVARDGRFVIGFGRDAAARFVLRAVAPDGLAEERVLAVEQRTYEVERINNLDADKVNPPPHAFRRIVSTV